MSHEQRRRVAIPLALVAGIALIAAAFGHEWLRSSFVDMKVGLLSVEAPVFGPVGSHAFEHMLRADPDCRIDGTCTISTSKFLDLCDELVDELTAERAHDPEKFEHVALPRKPSRAFVAFGWIALVSCLLAAAGLLASAGIAIANARPELPVLPTTVAILGLIGALVSGCVFVATKPDANGLLGAGWSFFAYGAGVILGIAGATLINKVIKPADPDLADMSMAWRGELP